MGFIWRVLSPILESLILVSRAINKLLTIGYNTLQKNICLCIHVCKLFDMYSGFWTCKFIYLLWDRLSASHSHLVSSSGWRKLVYGENEPGRVGTNEGIWPSLMKRHQWWERRGMAVGIVLRKKDWTFRVDSYYPIANLLLNQILE